MTVTRSQRSATTPKLCVTSSIAMCRSACRSRSRSSTSACTVTSSAVVGSSAMIRSGSVETAPAISTRWAMPPDTSNGYALNVRTGFGMPTRSSSERALSRASFLLMPSATRSGSVSWLPIVNDWSRLLIGSCGM